MCLRRRGCGARCGAIAAGKARALDPTPPNRSALRGVGLVHKSNLTATVPFNPEIRIPESEVRRLSSERSAVGHSGAHYLTATLPGEGVALELAANS